MRETNDTHYWLLKVAWGVAVTIQKWMIGVVIRRLLDASFPSQVLDTFTEESRAFYWTLCFCGICRFTGLSVFRWVPVRLSRLFHPTPWPGPRPEQGYTGRKLRSEISERAVDDWVRSLPAGLDEVLAGDQEVVSRGQLQRLNLGHLFCTCQDADLVILDKVLSALDEKSRDLLLERLEAFLQDKTAIIITHYSELLRICDVVHEMPSPNLLATGSGRRRSSAMPYRRSSILSARRSTSSRRESVTELVRESIIGDRAVLTSARCVACAGTSVDWTVEGIPLPPGANQRD